MTEEQIAVKKEHAGEKKASMKRRDDHHDYTERRMYMITLEVEGRRPVFGRLIGDAFAPKGSKEEPRIELTKLGQAVQNEWMGIHDYYPQIEVMAVQMMPDHMHGILFVQETMEEHLGQVISGFKAGCNKAYRRLVEAVPQHTLKAVPQQTVNGVASTYEVASPLRVEAVPQHTGEVEPQQTNNLPLPSEHRLKKEDRSHGLLFERGYNDLISKSYDMLPRLTNYLHDNPRRLAIRREHPDYFRVQFGVTVAGQTYAAIGNRFLLNSPDMAQVQLTRKLTEAQIAKEMYRTRVQIDQVLTEEQLTEFRARCKADRQKHHQDINRKKQDISPAKKAKRQ